MQGTLRASLGTRGADEIIAPATQIGIYHAEIIPFFLHEVRGKGKGERGKGNLWRDMREGREKI